MDYSRILNKPFLIDNLTWTNSSTVYSLLPRISLPSDALTNYLAKVPFQSSSLYRMKACVMLQVSGTPMHQGLLLASVIPYPYIPVNPTQLLQAPHSFLNANESTSVCIEVPFYQRTPLARTSTTSTEVGLSTFNYADLRLMVIDPLASSGTASTSLTISVHLILKEAEFYVPKISEATWVATGACVSGESDIKASCSIRQVTSKPPPPPVNTTFVAEGFIGNLMKIPTKIFDGLAYGAKVVTGDFIDTLRVGVKTITGFHNPNSTTIDSRMLYTNRNFPNQVDQPTLLEKLDQHGQFDRVVQDYQFNTDQDEMDVSYILSKPAFVGKFGVNTTTVSGSLLFAHPITPFIEANSSILYSPMRLLYECSRYWRGTLNLHLQSVMTNFQYCKLLVVRDYSGDRRLLTLHPEMADVHNLLTETLEFSAGGQIHTISLPFCSQLEQLECTKSLSTNALSHGMVYIYLLQPLTTNGTVPTSITFNTYFSAGEDFQFYGYAVDNIRSSYIPVSTSPDSILSKEDQSFVAEGSVTEGNEVTVGVSEQDDILNDRVDVSEPYLRVADFKPMTSIRDYLRRFIFSRSLTFEVSTATQGVAVSSILSLINNTSTAGASASLAIRKLFFGYYGGFKFKFLVKGAQNGRIYYVPPGSVFNATTGIMDATTPNTDWIKSKLNFLADSSKLCTVFQEVPITHSYQDSNSLATVTEYEFVVPNMNPYRFIGGLSSYSSTFTAFDGAFGHIITSFPIQSATTSITLEVYVGITDETRLGFQVLTNPFSIPTITTTGPPPVVYRDSPYNISATVGLTTDSTVYPGAYYFNLP
jgi:hypothetical protein